MFYRGLNVEEVKMPVITITRGSLSATYKLTQRLAREIPCRAISREEIIEHGKKYGIEEFLKAAKGIMETRPPHSWDPHAAQIHHYLVIFKAALMDFVAEGNLIYHGLQTHYLLTDVPRVLRVKVVAPLDYRVRTLREESNYNEAEAREHIQYVDAQRISWYRFLHGSEYDEMTNYDIIFNMEKLNLDAMTEVIDHVVRKPDFRIDAGAMKLIHDAHMKAKIRAYLVRSPKTREIDLTISCDCESGSVKLKCNAPEPIASDWKKDIEDALSELDVIRNIDVIGLES